MVEDLIDIAAGITEIGADVTAASLASKSGEEIKEEKKKKKKNALPGIIITIVLTIGLLYLFMWRWGLKEEFTLVIEKSGYLGAIGVIASVLIILLVTGLLAYIRKRNKEIKKIYIFIALSAICTAIIIFELFDDIDFTNPMEYIPLIGFTFGITLMFFLLFHKMGQLRVTQFVRLPYHLTVKVFVPMLPLWIIFLGAMQGKYGYESVFLIEANIGITKVFGGVVGDVLYKIIEGLFIMGSKRPGFFIFICIAALLYLIYDAIRFAFFKEVWPYSFFPNPEDYAEAQYFIDEARDEYISKEDLDAFKRGKLRLQKEYLNSKNELGEDGNKKNG